MVATILASLAVLAASGVAAFATYSWKWKETARSRPAADEAAVAGTYALEFAHGNPLAGVQVGGPVESLEQITKGLWRVRFKGDPGPPDYRWAIHLDDFEAGLPAAEGDIPKGVGYLGPC